MFLFVLSLPLMVLTCYCYMGESYNCDMCNILSNDKACRFAFAVQSLLYLPM